MVGYSLLKYNNDILLTIKTFHMKIKSLIVVAILVATTINVTAQTAGAEAKKVSTLKNDRFRIKQGAQSGQLTRKETAVLAKKTATLKEEKQEIKADGVVTTEERKDYRKDKKRLSKKIYRQKHDNQTRP